MLLNRDYVEPWCFCPHFGEQSEGINVISEKVKVTSSMKMNQNAIKFGLERFHLLVVYYIFALKQHGSRFVSKDERIWTKLATELW